MRGADACAGAIKSGGTTRRAAKMVVLNCDHPDIREFINCKAEEEKKAWALGRAGYDMGMHGEASAVDPVPERQQLGPRDRRVHARRRRHDGDVAHCGRSPPARRSRHVQGPRAAARDRRRRTWLCGDPGMQFDTTINRWHTCPNTGRINASNPCSEYMLLDDSACNLASLNLMKFVDDEGAFDWSTTSARPWTSRSPRRTSSSATLRLPHRGDRPERARLTASWVWDMPTSAPC